MENASKALIIAGAILLSILIISLGIMIFNQASGVINNNAMSEVEVQQFNQKFTQSGTSRVRGANVNSLLNTVAQNNVANAGDSSKLVKVVNSTNAANWIAGSGSTGGASNSAITGTAQIGQAQAGKLYTIAYDTDSNTGLITTITISDN